MENVEKEHVEGRTLMNIIIYIMEAPAPCI